jgi:hypothetical protein
MPREPRGQAVEPTKSADWIRLPAVAGSGAGLVGGALAAGGRACLHRPARSLHDLRHTAATLAVAAGASTRELMVRMGHSSSAAALRHQHVMAGRDAAIAAALDELIRAVSARSEDSAAAGSGTRVARTGQQRRKGDRR